MRLKPLRGQTYEVENLGPSIFLEMLSDKKLCKMVTSQNGLQAVEIEKLNLPIIDTKDYEKIEEGAKSDH